MLFKGFKLEENIDLLLILLLFVISLIFKLEDEEAFELLLVTLKILIFPF
jgi:hypothetical protein